MDPLQSYAFSHDKGKQINDRFHNKSPIIYNCMASDKKIYYYACYLATYVGLPNIHVSIH